MQESAGWMKIGVTNVISLVMLQGTAAKILTLELATIVRLQDMFKGIVQKVDHRHAIDVMSLATLQESVISPTLVIDEDRLG